MKTLTLIVALAAAPSATEPSLEPAFDTARDIVAAAAKRCLLERIDPSRDMCVYACSDGKPYERPVQRPRDDGFPTIACPQVVFPF